MLVTVIMIIIIITIIIMIINFVWMSITLRQKIKWARRNWRRIWWTEKDFKGKSKNKNVMTGITLIVKVTILTTK